MPTLTVNSLSRDGVDDAGVAADAGGDQFANSGAEFFRIHNGGGAQITVTIATQLAVDGEAVADKTVDVPAGESRVIGPFPTGLYNDSSNNIQLTYSGVTSVTVGVFSVPSVSSPFLTVQ